MSITAAASGSSEDTSDTTHPRHSAPADPESEIIRNRLWDFERATSQIWTVKYRDCRTLRCTYF